MWLRQMSFNADSLLSWLKLFHFLPVTPWIEIRKRGSSHLFGRGGIICRHSGRFQSGTKGRPSVFWTDTRQKIESRARVAFCKKKSFGRKCDHLSCREPGKQRVALRSTASDSWRQIKVHQNDYLPDSPKLWNRAFLLAKVDHMTLSNWSY